MGDPGALPRLDPEDIIIAVMGITGSGKSSFISQLVSDDVLIGHNLQSCTADIGVYSFRYRGLRRVYLIDTPGFDDTHRTDTEVLKDVAYFLSQTYKRDVRLTGIIYLHRITDIRMAGSSLRNLNMFKKLCGQQAYRHIVLATTMWSNLQGAGGSYAVGQQREQELLTTRDYWGLMHARGSKVMRHSGDANSALRIVEELIGRREKVVLDIQQEMIDKKLNLEDTAAGREVQKELQELRKRHLEHVQELRAGYEQAMRDRDMELAQELSSQRMDLEKKLQEASEAHRDLEINFERLENEKTAEYDRLLAEYEAEWGEAARMIEGYQRQIAQAAEEQSTAKEKYEAERALQQQQYEESIERIKRLEEQRMTAEAQVAKEEQRRLDEKAAEQKLRFQQDEEKRRADQAALQTMLEDYKSKAERRAARKKMALEWLKAAGLLATRVLLR